MPAIAPAYDYNTTLFYDVLHYMPHDVLRDDERAIRWLRANDVSFTYLARAGVNYGAEIEGERHRREDRRALS